jgi:hypothetical protein
VAEVKVNLTSDPDGQPSAVAESLMSFLKLLWESGGWLGALLVIAYAIVIPAIKLVLIFVGEACRNSKPLTSYRCIVFVQMVSKWASPDMFAYVLLLYLLRHMSHPPSILVTARLEVGFLAFSLFCINSTFSSLAIPLPELEDEGKKGKPLVLRCFGYCGMKVVAIILAVGFLAGWFYGIQASVMHLNLDINDLKISDNVKSILEKMHFAQLVQAEVTLIDCAEATLGWIKEGEIAMVMAFLLIVVFVIALPFFNVVVLATVAITHKPGSVIVNARSISAKDFNEAQGRNLGVKMAHVLGHTEMLDVFIMGICVIAAAGQAYHSDGIIIAIQGGLLYLLGAEVFHYILYYMILSVCEHQEVIVEK